MHLGILALHNKQQKTDEWKNKLLQSIRNYNKNRGLFKELVRDFLLYLQSYKLHKDYFY